MKILISVVLILMSIFNYAKANDDFRNCYDVFGGNLLAKETQNELFVLIDQTIKLDNNLKSMVFRKINEFMKPGNKLSLISFSTYQDSKYTQLLLSGQLDYPLTEDEKYSISKVDIRKFDSCIKKQTNYANSEIAKHLKSVLKSSDEKIANTEIIGNLHRISESLIANSKSPNKLILIVSDMLENSKALSFYRNGGVALPDPDAAIKITNDSKLTPSLKGSKIFVLGAGFNSKGYQNATTMKNINTFWQKYFELGGAQLVGWGQPELFEKIQ